MTETVVMRIHAAQGRRVLGVVTLSGLGALFLRIAFDGASTLFWQGALLALALAVWALAFALWRATGLAVELTETELRDSSGVLIARVADIRTLEKGSFALKPSQGFVLRLSHGAPLAWRPGLWWRVGQRVGVGGVVSARETGAMAEVLAARIARARDQLSDHAT